MGFSCGLVGLPNVGKSTLFNAITGLSVQASNYPFCTIDPSVGLAKVPDDRLYQLSKMSRSTEAIPAFVEFVDIAGLIRGASTGEGLGNRFLAKIREVSAICQIVRLFEDPNVVHVDGGVEPVRDWETIEAELALADYETAQKILDVGKKNRLTDKQKQILQTCSNHLAQGKRIYTLAQNWDKEESKFVRSLCFLTDKPMLVVANISEEQLRNDAYQKNPHYMQLLSICKEQGVEVVALCASQEASFSSWQDDAIREYLLLEGIGERPLNSLLKKGYQALGLITYFTTGEKETRAWTIRKGSTAPQAAGVIHTDFEKSFIKAEAVLWKDLLQWGSTQACKEKGILRLEGKEYIVQDGDVLLFRTNHRPS